MTSEAAPTIGWPRERLAWLTWLLLTPSRSSSASRPSASRQITDVEAELNGFWIDGAFKPSEAVHLGVGIALRGGGLIEAIGSLVSENTTTQHTVRVDGFSEEATFSVASPSTGFDLEMQPLPWASSTW